MANARSCPRAASPKPRAASTLLVAAKPAIADARATKRPASMPGSGGRRSLELRASGRQQAAWPPGGHAGLDCHAIEQHRLASRGSAIGAVTSSRASLAKTPAPRAPPIPPGGPQALERLHRVLAVSLFRPQVIQVPAGEGELLQEPQAILQARGARNPRSAGSCLTNRLKVPAVIPYRR